MDTWILKFLAFFFRSQKQPGDRNRRGKTDLLEGCPDLRRESALFSLPALVAEKGVIEKLTPRLRNHTH